MIRIPIPSLDGLTTARLAFRRPVMEDRAWWMGYMNNPEAIRFMPFALGSDDDCAAFIQRSLDSMAKDGSGLHTVIERETGKPVGMIGLLTQDVDGLPELEVGYHLLPSAWGKGFATEAAVACREFARTHDLAPSVISLIDPLNFRSQSVASRNGMVAEKRGMHRGTEVLVFRIALQQP